MISGYFRDGARVSILAKNGDELELLGRFPLERTVTDVNIPDDSLREEAEALRLKINSSLSSVAERDLVDLLEEINRITVAFEAPEDSDLAPEEREFYATSIQRALQRLRGALTGA